MKTNYLCFLFLVLLWAMIVTPASACAVAIEKTGPAKVCTDCEFTYVLKVFYEGNAGYSVKVSDTLPTGVTYVSSSDGGSYSPAIRTVCWTFAPMPAVPNYADKNKWWNKTVTITVRSSGSASELSNRAKAWYRTPASSWTGGAKSALVSTRVVPCYTELTKTAPEQACMNCDLTYNITVKYYGLDGQYVRVSDSLPGGADYVSSSDAGSNLSGTVSWVFGPVTDGWTKDLTLTLRPGSTGMLQNSVTSQIAFGSATAPFAASNVSLPWVTDIIPCTPTPEFPTMWIPGLSVAALLGLVFITKRYIP